VADVALRLVGAAAEATLGALRGEPTGATGPST
jgi:hypothetical protein